MYMYVYVYMYMCMRMCMCMCMCMCMYMYMYIYMLKQQIKKTQYKTNTYILSFCFWGFLCFTMKTPHSWISDPPKQGGGWYLLTLSGLIPLLEF